MQELVHRIPERGPVREEVNVGYGGANLLDAAGVLFHGYLLRGRLKAKEGLDVQAGGLLKARPVPVLWMHLKKGKINHPCYFFLFVCVCVATVFNEAWTQSGAASLA